MAAMSEYTFEELTELAVRYFAKTGKPVREPVQGVRRGDIGVTVKGQIELLTEGHWREVWFAEPEPGDKGMTKGFGYPWFWRVLYTDGTTETVSGLHMKAALHRRNVEGCAGQFFPP